MTLETTDAYIERRLEEFVEEAERPPAEVAAVIVYLELMDRWRDGGVIQPSQGERNNSPS